MLSHHDYTNKKRRVVLDRGGEERIFLGCKQGFFISFVASERKQSLILVVNELAALPVTVASLAY